MSARIIVAEPGRLRVPYFVWVVNHSLDEVVVVESPLFVVINCILLTGECFAGVGATVGVELGSLKK